MSTEHAGTCLFVNNSPEPGRGKLAKLGGGGHSLLGLLETLPRFGWKCHVVVPADGPLTEELRSRGIPNTVFPFKSPAWDQPAQTLSDFLRWRQIFNTVRPTIIHANAMGLHRSFAFPAFLNRLPVVSHCRFPPPEDRVRWMCRLQPKPRGFIFTSEALRNALWPAITRHCAPTRDFVVHNAVDLRAFTPSPWPESDKLRIGIVGNLLPIKRHEDFLYMAAEIVSKGCQAEFWVIGADTEGKGHGEKLQNLAADLGLSKHAKFLGHRTDIADIMRQLHVVVLTSQYESFGRVLIEAMACGRPVVATRAGGIPEVVREDETGYLFDVGDYLGMAKAVLLLVSDQALWSRMSQAALHDALDRFSLERHTHHIVDIYSAILDH